MTLLLSFLSLCDEWHAVFAQERTVARAVRHALSGLCSLGRRTISRAIMSAQRQAQDWSGDYLLYSRSPWDAARVFTPAVQSTAAQSYPGHIAVAFDDTRIKKTGKKVPGAQWHRDPLSPAFHVNFIYGLRFLQGSALVPLHQRDELPARGIPVCFHEARIVKRPGTRATPDDWTAYRAARRTENLSVQFIAAARQLRAAYDAAGAADKLLVAVCDGSFCNRTVLRAPTARMTIVARCRKDARLCRPAPPGSRRVYDLASFTPDQVRQDAAIAWQTALVYHGGQRRMVRYKELAQVCWQRGGGRQHLRLIVIAPTPYRTSRTGKLYYRAPAYLLTTDLVTPAALLIQMYFDRWEIEVNFREEKDTLGIGQAQVWSANAVPRQPAFMVAAYSLLLIAGLQAYGARRTNAYLPLPLWRRNARRPSCLDLIAQLRHEISTHAELVKPYGMCVDADGLVRAAAA